VTISKANAIKRIDFDAAPFAEILIVSAHLRYWFPLARENALAGGQTGCMGRKMTRGISTILKTYCASDFPIPSKPKATDYDVGPIAELEWRLDMRQKLGHPLTAIVWAAEIFSR